MKNKKVHYIRNSFEHNKRVKKYNKYIKDETNYPIEEADIIACGGGDGTLLKTIKEYRKYNLPFWGVNAGTLGFLMNEDYPWKFKEKEVVTIELSLIKAEVTYLKEVRDMASIDTKKVKRTIIEQGFNEIVIGGDMNSWINFDVHEEDMLFEQFKGGGFIVSTPQGSIGINKNNSGVILPIDADMWSVTGDKTDRKIDYVISPKEININVSSRSRVDVWIDGAGTHIKNVIKVKITKGDTVKVMFGDFNSFKLRRRY